ncbi:MAG: hypothetical protein RR049_02550, partial [Angelakisella sp.]
WCNEWSFTNHCECTAEIAQAASDYLRLQTLMEQKEELEAQLETQTGRWIYLNELAENIEKQTRL